MTMKMKIQEGKANVKAINTTVLMRNPAVPRRFLRPAIGGLLLVTVLTVLTACGGGGSGGGVVYPAGTSSPAAVSPPANPALVPPDAPRAVDLVPPAAQPGPTTPTAPATPTQPAKTLKDQIAEAEASGKYPKLDRSSDIAGPDVNHNGVRDDIEAWISAQPVSEPQRKSLMQIARALQKTLLVELNDKAAMDRSGDELSAASKCGSIQFSPFQAYTQLSGRIESMTANTKERAVRYMQYNAAASGSSGTLPNYDSCEQ